MGMPTGVLLHCCQVAVIALGVSMSYLCSIKASCGNRRIRVNGTFSCFFQPMISFLWEYGNSDLMHKARSPSTSLTVS